MRDITEAIRRGVGVMVRSLGAATVVLRIPAPPVAGDAGEELGLRSPEFENKKLAPVAVRKRKEGVQVLVAAGVLEASLGAFGSGAVNVVMHTVTAVQMGDEVFAFAGMESADVMGRACLYRLLLQPRASEVA